MSRPFPRLRVPVLDFQPVRDELEIPVAFPPEVEAAAAAAAKAPRLPSVDATDVELITVDPPGSMDLDQALHVATRPGGGFRVHYAIADVAAFVIAGDPIDVEARKRGETLYSPDLRTPLHPTAIGEGAASLLPDQDRPALLWQIDLDSSGRQVAVDLRRAMVRSRARLDYAGLQQMLDAGTAPAATTALPEIGRLRAAIAAERGAIELGLPDQEVEQVDGRWTVVRRQPLPVESWNADISLLTGMAAAGLMLDAKIGLLRTLPPAEQFTVDQLRHAARALEVPWPHGTTPADLIRSLDPAQPAQAALLEEAAHLLRGAGYTPFDGEVPGETGHAGVGAPYAHVTAPIRRLCDRFTNEVCVAVAAGAEVPAWARDALPLLPALMAASGNRAHRLDREAVDLTEAWLLADRVGQTFAAAVVESDAKGVTVMLDDPPVRARCTGRPELGTRIEVRLTAADTASRSVTFAPV